MYIDKYYPFSMMELGYSLTSFDDFLDFKTLSIHYNQIYKSYVDSLNEVVAKNNELKNLSLDELLFNEKLISSNIRKNVIYNATGIYNHQIIFQSITPNPVVKISTELKKAIEAKYRTLNGFYLEFKKACNELKEPGFVFLVCDESLNVFIYPAKSNTSPVVKNLCPIMGIDLFEHAYYLKYLNNKKAYVDNFLKYINYDFVNSEYRACVEAVYKKNA